MINELIDKYGTLLNILRDNKSTKSKTDTYDYNTDIKNTREYLKDLKALKQQLTIPVVVKSFYCECKEPLELQHEVGLTIYCEECGKNVKQ